jgi:succinoglycan biosynthesis protein ExoM
MTEGNKHISVCICTFKRPMLLKRLLDELDKQYTEGLFNYSVVVVDNDIAQSGRKVTAEFAAHSSIHTSYLVEPQQNIALARNKALANARGDFIAFIDDDEYPAKKWLYALFKTGNESSADGVLGPVKPYFEQYPPQWAIRGKFFERPTHATGYRISLSDARTGNVMFKSKILDGVEAPFGTEFGTGGEDVDFFSRMMGKGYTFIWSNEAIVYEAIPPNRCTRRYLLRRALLRGKNSSRLPVGRVCNLFKSFIAVPVYGLSLPVFFIAGEHYFLNLLIKFCYHAGRLLGVLGFNPVRKSDI